MRNDVFHFLAFERLVSEKAINNRRERCPMLVTV